MDKKPKQGCPKIPPTIQTDWDVDERKPIQNSFKNTSWQICDREKKMMVRQIE